MDLAFTQWPGFVRQHGAAFGAAAAIIILFLIALVFLLSNRNQQPVKQVETITIVAVQLPKPPPPPPPPPEMIQQPKITTPIAKPTEPAPPTKVATPKAAAPAAPPLGTSIHSNAAPDSFNLSGNTGGNGLLGGGGGEGGSGAWSYYASLLQGQLNQALHANKKTTNASFQVTTRVWVDATGLVTRVVVAPSGNDVIDAAIRNEVLAGMKFSAPPPAGMPMPIVISLTGQQPLQ
jgi:periplasmic protein TonB